MKVIATIAAILGVASAIALPAELQERQCTNNGPIQCGGDVYNCEPPGTACVQGKKGTKGGNGS
ncbi:hypothetical protein yc1106_02016 [Curvularia clavata]|uniref:Uncharacterized protein n=1 Tax=Curvularia clavata TaxID=95742 RepID=A0A9Q8Z233_CURCL|nr:hypothetical protein yc1106_02016 [Curvularia clavata]